jgi:anti-sigma B factor antagonist
MPSTPEQSSSGAKFIEKSWALRGKFKSFRLGYLNKTLRRLLPAPGQPGQSAQAASYNRARPASASAGRITLADGSGLVRSTVQELAKAGHRKILLNLAEVSYSDSAGLGELASAYATVTALGGKVRLLNPQPKVNEMLRLTRIQNLFLTFYDEAEALRSF